MLSPPTSKDRRGKRIQRRHPLAPNSVRDSIARHSERSTGRRNGGVGHAAHHHGNGHSSTTPILRLLLWCGPAAVRRLVVPVIVDAINRMGWRRARPHVRSKVGKVTPPFANGDSSISVGAGIFCFRRPTPAAHFAPRAICRIGRPRISSGHEKQIADSRFVLKFGVGA